MGRDVYQEITDTIIAALEQGTRPWLKPWSAEHAAGQISRPLRFNGQPYSGVNILMLWGRATAEGYAAPLWMTFRQARTLGGAVRKGEKGTLVVYASTVKRADTDEDTGETRERDIPFLRGYTVFNVEQIDGLPAHYYATATAPTLEPGARLRLVDAFFAATGATIEHGGNQAYYAIGPDHIRVPPFESFRSPESYYATLAHEATHWTRHPSRLAREFGRKRFGDEGYAMEELVAELGAAFLCADLEVTPEVQPGHAAYIEAWLRVLKGDKRALFTAAAHASRAADYLHELQPGNGAGQAATRPIPDPSAPR